MAIITVTTEVTERNTRTVNTAKGETKVISVPIIKDKEDKFIYASAFLPQFIELDDTVTITGTIQRKEDGEYVNYNFNFPTVERLYKAVNRGVNQPTGSVDTSGDLPF